MLNISALVIRKLESQNTLSISMLVISLLSTWVLENPILLISLICETQLYNWELYEHLHIVLSTVAGTKYGLNCEKG
jgi:hypothetical protein